MTYSPHLACSYVLAIGEKRIRVTVRGGGYFTKRGEEVRTFCYHSKISPLATTYGGDVDVTEGDMKCYS